MSLTVPLVDLAGQYQALRPQLEAAVNRVLAGGWYILGEEVRAFEAEFAAYLGVAHGVGVASGTDAVALALRAVGVAPGDEVITVSHTAVATVVGLEQAGARPVFVDIDPATFTMNPARLEAAISPRTRAIVPVHLYGHPAEMAAIMTIARRHHLAVVEDCAQAHGAWYQGQRVGRWGDAAAFSFYPTKNLGATGDGGMVVTNRAEVAERVRLLRQYGWAERFVSQVRGSNSRLDELQAAILRVKLPYLERWNEQRRALAAHYTALLAETRLVLPQAARETSPVYHLYVVRAKNRAALLAHLQRQGIGAQVHYPLPVHLQPAYADLGFGPGSLPETEQAASEVLSLPLYPEMSLEIVEKVVEIIKQRS
ncbi:MAG: erythromycin biosynthesis sensory transduction protein eryC1 [Anaerolineae bacterium]|nr:erythromycin biosynthesis sensory transduction protein eryC1 [Anaerolineae bacterium]